MTLKNKLYFFFTIVTISFILDKYLNPCKNLNILANIIHFIHHIGSNYFFYGALIFDEYVFHFILSIITILSWFVNKGRCFVSDIYNKMCGLKPGTRHQDLTHYLIKYILKINIYEFISIIVLYDLYNLLTY